MIKNNRKLFMFLVFLLVISISTVVYANNALITVNNLNVRSGPGLEFETIGQIHEGETYPILQEQGDWVQITIGDMTGWVTKQYIEVDSTEYREEPMKEEPEAPEKLVVRFDRTNVRNGPSTDYEIIDYVDKGEILSVTNVIGDWIEVQWKDKTAYLPRIVTQTETTPLKQESYGLKNKVIVIDAGHGGRDVGAIGASGTFEKHMTLRTTNKLKTQLETLGAQVILTRKKDNYLSLSGRASVSNVVKADVFLSVHYNSTPQYPNVTGVGTYYYSDKDRQLAKTMQQEILKATNMNNRGAQFASFQVTRENHRPAILLELGFLSNITEESNIQSSVFQEKITKGIIRGLTRHFQ